MIGVRLGSALAVIGTHSAATSRAGVVSATCGGAAADWGGWLASAWPLAIAATNCPSRWSGRGGFLRDHGSRADGTTGSTTGCAATATGCGRATRRTASSPSARARAATSRTRRSRTAAPGAAGSRWGSSPAGRRTASADSPPRTLAGCDPPRDRGMGMGRLRADLASCSADMAWYMSKPMKAMAL